MPSWVFIVVGAVIVLYALYLLRNRGPRDLEGKVDAVGDRFEVDQGVVKSKVQTYRAGQQDTANTAVTNLQETLINNDFKIRHKKEELELGKRASDAQVTAQAVISEEQARLKLDPVSFQKEKTEKAVRKTYRKNKEVDKEVYAFEKEIDVKGAIIARIAEHYEIEVLTEAFNRAVDNRQLLLQEDDTEARRQKLERLDKNIKDLDKAIDGKGQKLIQGNSGPDVGTSDED